MASGIVKMSENKIAASRGKRASGCKGVGLDWTTSLGKARALVGQKVALQGNLDPMVLFADPAAVQTETRRVLDSFEIGRAHV